MRRYFDDISKCSMSMEIHSINKSKASIVSRRMKLIEKADKIVKMDIVESCCKKLKVNEELY